MAKPQVRLDDDVAAALGRAADRSGRSASQEANWWLRKALGLAAAGNRQPATAATASASVSAPQAPCRHPINRRIGNRCGACGATLGR